MKEKNPCMFCEGKVGEDGTTGYWVYNAYEKGYRRWVTCEYCNGLGYMSFEDLNFMLDDEGCAGNA